MTETLTLGALVKRIEQLERRLVELEKNSHPPVDLTPHIKEALDEALMERGLW